MSRRLFLTPLLVLGCVSVPMNAASPAGPADFDVERGFTQTVQPFLNAYCTSCHGGATPAAQLDLRQYATAATAESVIQDFPRWNRVLARLTAREMPPKQMKQPPDEARQQVISWIQATWADEGRKHDGDPGVVLARRLSNAEYNYTIRDLTGVDMRPAKEFPVDPANQSGFDNSGESLAMSPALLTKYLLASRRVAEHIVLTPAGFVFAPHPVITETDRDKYCVRRIIDFYQKQPTDLADYFMTAWRFQHRARLGQPKATLADFAAKDRVSSKYLALIWSTLTKPEEAGPVATLQAMWRRLPAPVGKQADAARPGCEGVRDFVVVLREKLEPSVTKLAVPCIS